MINEQYALPQEHPVGSNAFKPNYESGHINVGNFERAASAAIGGFLIFNSLGKIFRSPLRSISRIGAGTALLYRGLSGYCPVYDQMNIDGTKNSSVNMLTTFTVNKPREEVYNFWRKLENLPLFMKHLVSVTSIDGTRSHWEAKIPEGNPISVKWDAEIMKDDPGRLLSWRSLPGSTIDNAGKVEFRDALGGHGTELKVMITYRPPAGNIGSGVAKLLNPLFEKVIREDVNNFKSFIDAGNVTALAH
ncbi:MAG TPA: SRPBCC family protein [Flavitalea sp.]|nr:SRPBCC family protein [Flavitalea sp.]